MKGQILAAGMGTRLLPLTSDRPKALMNIGGTTLLGRIINQCAEVGMEEVIVVTGYRSDTLGRSIDGMVDVVAPLATFYGLAFCLHNNGNGTDWVLLMNQKEL